MTKRIFDIVFSCLGLILLAPVLVVLAIIIKLDSKGPVLFIQPRVGLNNKDFNIFKLKRANNLPNDGSLDCKSNNVLYKNTNKRSLFLIQ